MPTLARAQVHARAHAAQQQDWGGGVVRPSPKNENIDGAKGPAHVRT